MKNLSLCMAMLCSVLVLSTTGLVFADPIGKKGTTPYVTHFVFRPVLNLDVPGLGSATLLEATGTTENLDGKKMLDKMSARCAVLNVASGLQQ